MGGLVCQYWNHILSPAQTALVLVAERRRCNLHRSVELRLTEKTTVIRADNQDSFQGPVEFAGFDQEQNK